MIDFKEIITTKVLAEYLTADFGKDLVIWEDGHTTIMDSSWVLRRKAVIHPICRVQCPGINNLDATVFSKDYAAQNKEGDYVEVDTGRVIGDLASMICWTCHEGDVSAFMEDLIAKCENSLENCNESY